MDNYICLTFDDSPSPVTNELLDCLASLDIKATFFVTGANCEGGGADMLKRIAAEGHEIGNHAYTHIDWSEADVPEMSADFSRCQELIQELTKQTPVFFKAPYYLGSLPMLAVVDEMGLWYTGSDFESHDYTGVPVADLRVWLLSRLTSGRVYSFHDLPSSNIIEALPSIAEGVRSQGFGFRRLCERGSPNPPDAR